MDDEAMRERARELRLGGASCHQIAEELGLTRHRAERLVKGLPVPGWTRRPRAKDDLRARARELRAAGWTYPQIAAELGVSKSSCSLWLRDMKPPPTPEEQKRFKSERAYAMWRGLWKKKLALREAERTAQKLAAAYEIGPIRERDLLIAGTVLYWAEGSKSKPWRRSERVVFVNSDADLVRLYLTWLRTVGVTEDRLRLYVQIHESADVPAAVRFWADVTGIPEERFGKTTLKRHNPKTVRKNVGDTYHGCLSIRVLKGAELYRRIDGWMAGIVHGARAVEARRDTVGNAPVIDIAKLRAHLTGRSRIV